MQPNSPMRSDDIRLDTSTLSSLAYWQRRMPLGEGFASLARQYDCITRWAFPAWPGDPATSQSGTTKQSKTRIHVLRLWTMIFFGGFIIFAVPVVPSQELTTMLSSAPSRVYSTHIQEVTCLGHWNAIQNLTTCFFPYSEGVSNTHGDR